MPQARRRVPYSNLPPVGPINAAQDVLFYLSSARAWNQPPFAFAVLKSYCDLKLARGKMLNDLDQKLSIIESQLVPHFEPIVSEIREYYGLPVTQMMRGSRIARISTTGGSTGRPTASGGGTAATGTRITRTSTTTSATTTSSAANRRPAVTRQETGDGELPPPPYAPTDPDPESTAMLTVMQASGVPDEAPAPPPASPPATTPANQQATLGRIPSASASLHGRTPSTASSFNPGTPSNEHAGQFSGDAPRPNDFPATPAARVGNQALSPSGANGSNGPERSDSEDPDVQRIREESELEEAMRASRAAEKERLEYQRAIQESIAQYEEDTMLRSASTAMYQSESPAGPSTQRPGADDGVRRTSSYHPSGSAPVGAMRRTQTTHRGASQASNDEEDLLGLSGEPTYTGTGKGKARPAATHAESLMDLMDNISLSVPPLEPTKTGPMSPPRQATVQALPDSPSVIVPQSTGMQSNNPFLSEAERRRLSQQQQPAVASPPPANHTPPHTESPPITHGHEERVGSVSSFERHYPALERELPPIPSDDYDSPDGPPPGWQGPPLSPITEATAPRPLPIPGQQYQQQTAPPVPPLPSRMSTNGAGMIPIPVPMPHGAEPMSPGSHFVVSSPPQSPGIHTPTVTAFPTPYAHSGGLAPATPPALPARSASPAPILIGGENALEMLREYDTVFLVDDSTSMKGDRWEQAKTAIMGVVAQAVRYDEDGVDVYFLNSKRVGKGLHNTADVEELFAGLDPKGATPTGLRIESILRDYMARLERSVADGNAADIRSMNLIVVTDGAFAIPVLRRARFTSDPLERDTLLRTAPTDDPESVLISIAKRLDRGDFPLSQVGVQLLQIGNDADAREALQELDEGLAHAHGVRDMVDTVPYNGQELSANLIVKVLLGGINRRIDRKMPVV